MVTSGPHKLPAPDSGCPHSNGCVITHIILYTSEIRYNPQKAGDSYPGECARFWGAISRFPTIPVYVFKISYKSVFFSWPLFRYSMAPFFFGAGRYDSIFREKGPFWNVYIHNSSMKPTGFRSARGPIGDVRVK